MYEVQCRSGLMCAKNHIGIRRVVYITDLHDSRLYGLSF